MKKVHLFVALVGLVFATPLFAAGAAVKHGLQTIDEKWMKAMLAGDAAAVAAVYAEDAVLVLPGSPAIKGRKAIQEAYAGWFKANKIVDVALTESHYESSGNISTGWGSWKMTTAPAAGGAPTTQTGTFAAVAMKKNGVWKYVSDHASEDPPAAK
jgi:uncharacterized protein (TIGR02246 family)